MLFGTVHEETHDLPNVFEGEGDLSGVASPSTPLFWWGQSFLDIVADYAVQSLLIDTGKKRSLFYRKG